MDTFNKWFAGLVEILKTVSHEPSYTEFKGKFVDDSFFFCSVWKKECTAMFIFLLLLISGKQFQPVNHSVRPLCLFSTNYIWRSGN